MLKALYFLQFCNFPLPTIFGKHTFRFKGNYMHSTEDIIWWYCETNCEQFFTLNAAPPSPISYCSLYTVYVLPVGQRTDVMD